MYIQQTPKPEMTKMFFETDQWAVHKLRNALFNEGVSHLFYAQV